ncbi:hypothetical protein D3C76_1754950 [compost metagenome]
MHPLNVGPTKLCYQPWVLSERTDTDDGIIHIGVHIQYRCPVHRNPQRIQLTADEFTEQIGCFGDFA